MFSSHGSNPLIRRAIDSERFRFCCLHLHLLDPTRMPLAQRTCSWRPTHALGAHTFMLLAPQICFWRYPHALGAPHMLLAPHTCMLPSAVKKNGKTKSETDVISMKFGRTDFIIGQSKATFCEESAGDVGIDVAPQKPDKNAEKRAFETEQIANIIFWVSKNESLWIVWNSFWWSLRPIAALFEGWTPVQKSRKKLKFAKSMLLKFVRAL